MEYSSELAHCKRIESGSPYRAALWRVWWHHYRTRKQLHRLLIGDPKHLHNDLGLSTEDALAEINKPFWRR